MLPCVNDVYQELQSALIMIIQYLVVSVDIMDISGELQRDVSHNVLKTRLDQNGVIVPNSFSAELRNDLDKMHEPKQGGYCGSCYGGLEPESGCCNTCEEVRQAYVNRGWSFSNPDAIEQVCPLLCSFVEPSNQTPQPLKLVSQ